MPYTRKNNLKPDNSGDSHMMKSMADDCNKSDKIITFSDIQKKIDDGEVVVLTAQEICDSVRAGEQIHLEDVDVVTTATRGIMSGTYAVLSFKVAEPDAFVRASKVWLNGVPAHVGPCPNERLGVLDLIVLGTAHSKSDPTYGGGHLFKELVEGKSIIVEVETVEGYGFTTITTIMEIPHAMLFATRHAFKNYLAFVNPGKEAVPSIFHAVNFEGDMSELTFSGCGELNPLQNDPDLETVGVGTKVMVNGADGFISGTGTRSSAEKPNLACFADMHNMNPEYMGGFLTSLGPEVINTLAVAIPVLNQGILDNIIKLDEDIKLKVVDLRGRTPLFEITYGDVWGGTDKAVTYNSEKCIKCKVCKVQKTCPMRAVTSNGETEAVHNQLLCFNCGLCISKCNGQAFSANLGTIRYNNGEMEKEIPVTLRQSDRARAVKAAEELKEKILSGEFRIKEPIEKIILK